MSKFRTHYDNLQIAENASIEVIRGAYKYLSQAWHPDKHPNDAERAARIMKLINEAYSVLSDPEQRKIHDAWILRQRTDQEAGHSADEENATRDGAQKKAGNTNSGRKNEPPLHQSANSFSGQNHPWRRYFARTIDLITGGFLVFLGAAFLIDSLSPRLANYISDLITNEFAAGMLACATWIPVEALLIATTGTTPAKWIFGISIKKANGTYLTFSESLSRSFLVWVQGMFFAIPLAVAVSNYFAYRRLTKTGSTLWDSATNSIVEHRHWGFFRLILVLTVSFLSLMLISILNKIDNSGQPKHTNSYLFHFENKCSRQIRLVLNYRGIDGNWRTDGFWNLDGGFSGYLQDANGNNLRTNNGVWYYYADTTDNSRLEWRGNQYFEYAGIQFPMIELRSDSGNNSWSITCQ